MSTEQYDLYNDAPVIRTHSGLYMNVFEPTQEMICIEDIAHALSMQCRFGGHLPQFYSVAQHSVECSKRTNFSFEALMHDASEAYLLDIPRPIKLRLANYKEIEDRLMASIAMKFQFQWPLRNAVKRVDEIMLQLEWDNFVKKTDSSLVINNNSKELFLECFYKLKP